MKQIRCTLGIAIFSSVLALLGITQAAAQVEFPRVIGLKDLRGSATCDCYYNRECPRGHYCTVSSCTKNGRNDRRCGVLALGDFGISALTFSRAVDFYYQAYITSAKGEGGPPDLDAVRRAQDQSLTVDGHFTVQEIVHNALDLTLGYDFVAPQATCGRSADDDQIDSDDQVDPDDQIDSDDQIDPGGLGQIRLSAEDAVPEGIELAEIVHQGVIAAIKANDPNVIVEPIRSFWSKHPDYEPLYSGRCWSHFLSDFPYETAEECQIEELTDILSLLLLRESEGDDP